MIDSSTRKPGRESNSRSGVTVVCGHSETVQNAWKDREPLLPRYLDARNMGARAVDGLQPQVSRKIRVVLRKECSGRVDRVGQCFVKEAPLQNSQGLEKVLDQDVVIVGFGG